MTSSHHSTSPFSDETPPDPRAHGPFAAIRRALPAGEVIRFLLVGGFNTVFSLALYSGFVLLFGRLMPHSGKPFIAFIAYAASTPINITVAFLCYKHFVFRTHGNYLKEWLRCFAVYSVSSLVGLVIVFTATKLLDLVPAVHSYAALLAGLINSVVTACYSYFAHKKFSFKR